MLQRRADGPRAPAGSPAACPSGRIETKPDGVLARGLARFDGSASSSTAHTFSDVRALEVLDGLQAAAIDVGGALELSTALEVTLGS